MQSSLPRTDVLGPIIPPFGLDDVEDILSICVHLRQMIWGFSVLPCPGPQQARCWLVGVGVSVVRFPIRVIRVHLSRLAVDQW